MLIDRRQFVAAATAAFGCAAPALSWAQEIYPSGPVRMIIPFAAGGGVDVPGRALARALGETLGKQVVVENKVGAGGTVGTVAAAGAKPDGYTILLGTSAQIVGKQLQPSVTFDPLTDFIPISLAYNTQAMITVSSRSKIKSIGELVEWARSRPGDLNYFSGGVGTAAHVLGATLSHKSGMTTVHIPVRTVFDMMTQLGDEATHFGCWITPTVLPLVESGQLRALAVTSRNRLPTLPDVPTLFEVFKDEDFVQESWASIWVPAKTPQTIVKTLFEASTKAVRSPAFTEFMEKQAQSAVASSSPEEFAEFMRAESRKWAKLLALVDIKPN